MSQNFRARLATRRIILQITPEQMDYLEKDMEEFCRAADQKCTEIDPVKPVDQVIDEMTDEEFDKFTKPLIEDVTNKIKKRKNRKWFGDSATAETQDYKYPSDTNPVGSAPGAPQKPMEVPA